MITIHPGRLAVPRAAQRTNPHAACDAYWITAHPARFSTIELVNEPTPASTKTHRSFAACARVRSAGVKARAAEAVASVLVAPLKSRFHPKPCESSGGGKSVNPRDKVR